MTRAWIRYGAGERVLCPLCSRRLGDVSPNTVALVRRAGETPEAGSVIQQCPRETCRVLYELQTLIAAAAA